MSSANVYVVVSKGKLVFATDSKQWADNFMVTLVHVRPRLANQTGIGTATSQSHLEECIEAWGHFPIWVDEKEPKNRRRVWTVFLERNKPEYNTLSLFSTFNEKGAKWVRDALESISVESVYGGTFTTDPLFKKGLLDPLLRPL